MRLLQVSKNMGYLTLSFNRCRWTRQNPRKAKEAGVSGINSNDKIWAFWFYLWKTRYISSRWLFATNTTTRWYKAVQKIFQKLVGQWRYLILVNTKVGIQTSDEEYFTESQLVEVYCDAEGNMIGGCAKWTRRELLKKNPYFFRMSKYADRLL